MATLFVTPVRTIDQSNGRVVPVYVDEPDGSGFDQTIKADFTSGAAKTSARVPEGAEYVELLADTNCYVILQDQGAGAAASTNDRPLTAGLPKVVKLPGGTPNSGWGYSAVTRS